MKHPMRYLTLAVLQLCWLLMPVPVAAQATVVSVNPEDKADQVAVIRFASANSVPIERGMELQPGDLVQASSPEVLLELQCENKGDSTAYLLSGPFGVMIGVTEGKMCHMIMLRGNMDVLGSEKTQTDAGEVSMISKGTQYAVRLGSTPENTRVRLRKSRARKTQV